MISERYFHTKIYSTRTFVQAFNVFGHLKTFVAYDYLYTTNYAVISSFFLPLRAYNNFSLKLIKSRYSNYLVNPVYNLESFSFNSPIHFVKLRSFLENFPKNYKHMFYVPYVQFGDNKFDLSEYSYFINLTKKFSTMDFFFWRFKSSFAFYYLFFYQIYLLKFIVLNGYLHSTFKETSCKKIL